MVFDNVTIFELHLDDARFGAAADEPADEPASRRGAVVPVGLLVLAGVGAAAMARRRRAGDDLAVDLEDAERIPVE